MRDRGSVAWLTSDETRGHRGGAGQGASPQRRRKVPVTKRPPTVSVGLAYGTAWMSSGRCIESILSQEFPDLELVISDNASNDGTETFSRSTPEPIGV